MPISSLIIYCGKLRDNVEKGKAEEELQASGSKVDNTGPGSMLSLAACSLRLGPMLLFMNRKYRHLALIDHFFGMLRFE